MADQRERPKPRFCRNERCRKMFFPPVGKGWMQCCSQGCKLVFDAHMIASANPTQPCYHQGCHVRFSLTGRSTPRKRFCSAGCRDAVTRADKIERVE